MAKAWIRDKGDIQKYYRKSDYETWSQDPGAAGDEMWGKHIKYERTQGWENVAEYKQAWHELGQAGKLSRLNKKGMKKNIGAMDKNVGKAVTRAREIQTENRALAAETAAAEKLAAEQGRARARGIATGGMEGYARKMGSRAAIRRRTMLGGDEDQAGRVMGSA
jgi:hypothetical protein